MKRLLMLTLGGLMAGTVAMAEEDSATTKTKHKKSHSMVTGKDTDTTTKEKKMKGADGSKHKVKKEDSTSVKPDGSTDKKSTSEESNTPAN